MRRFIEHFYLTIKEVFMSNQSIDIVEFNKFLFQFPWFVCVEELQNKFVVTVNEVNSVTNSLVPAKFAGKQVLLQNKSFKYVDKSDYINVVDLSSVVDDGALHSLNWLLERFSRGFLQDLVYEIHDGDDSITCFSESFPKEFDIMTYVYSKLGLDLILNYLE